MLMSEDAQMIFFGFVTPFLVLLVVNACGYPWLIV